MPTINLLYFSDTHAKGLQAQWAYKIKERLKDQQVLVINGGDWRGKVDPDDLLGNLEIKILNETMGERHTRVSVIGNHEINADSDKLVERLSELNSKILVTNMEFPDSSQFNTLKEQGKLIGSLEYNSGNAEFIIYGITTTELKDKAVKPAFEVMDLTTTKDLLVKKIEDTASRNIIIVSHLGITDDKKLATYLIGNLSSNKRDICIIGAHSHTPIKNPIVNENGEVKVYIMQCAAYSKAVGFAHVQYDANGKITEINNKLEPVSATDKKDTAVSELVELKNTYLNGKLENRIGQQVDQAIIKVMGHFSTQDWLAKEACLTDEETNYYSNLGHLKVCDTTFTRLFADAMAERANVLCESGVIKSNDEVKYHAFFPAAGIRNNFSVDKAYIGIDVNKEYAFTRKDLAEMDELQQYLVVLPPLKGEVVSKMLEYGVSKRDYWLARGGMLHTDRGVTYTYYANNEAGKRVSEIKIDGELLVMEKDYFFVTTDLLIGARYDGELFLELEETLNLLEDQKIFEIVEEYVSKTYSQGSQSLKEEFSQRIHCHINNEGKIYKSGDPSFMKKLVGFAQPKALKEDKAQATGRYSNVSQFRNTMFANSLIFQEQSEKCLENSANKRDENEMATAFQNA